jgi:hypothetical protein
MKKFFFLLAMIAGIAISCISQKSSPPAPLQAERGVEQPPVYLTGRDEPAASSAGSKVSECPVYYTGNDEVAANSMSDIKDAL